MGYMCSVQMHMRLMLWKTIKFLNRLVAKNSVPHDTENHTAFNTGLSG